jgi:hypothetical protein
MTHWKTGQLEIAIYAICSPASLVAGEDRQKPRKFCDRYSQANPSELSNLPTERNGNDKQSHNGDRNNGNHWKLGWKGVAAQHSDHWPESGNKIEDEEHPVMPSCGPWTRRGDFRVPCPMEIPGIINQLFRLLSISRNRSPGE